MEGGGFDHHDTRIHTHIHRNAHTIQGQRGENTGPEIILPLFSPSSPPFLPALLPLLLFLVADLSWVKQKR